MNNMKSEVKKKIVIKELKNELKTDLEIYTYEYKENLKKIKVDNLLKLDELATDKLPLFIKIKYSIYIKYKRI